MLFRFIRIFQCRGLVEDWMVRGGILVHDVVAGALKLDGNAGGIVQKGGFRVALGNDQAFRIQEILVVLVLRDLGHIGQGEEAVVVAEFQFLCKLLGHPVDGALDGTIFR